MLPTVTLHVRVWIEIITFASKGIKVTVTLHVRVWIEIACSSSSPVSTAVTLHVRVWIEIRCYEAGTFCNERHPPREGVD